MLTYKNAKLRHHHSRNFLLTFLRAFNTVIVECISSEELYIVDPKATCHIIRQASINAHTSVRYPLLTVKQAALPINEG